MISPSFQSKRWNYVHDLSLRPPEAAKDPVIAAYF